MTEPQVPVSIRAFGATPQIGTATVVEQTPGQRLLRALAGIGIIPVAHFVLVPTFLAAGLVMGAKRAREDRRLLGVHGACPRCGVEQEFRVGGRFFNGRAVDCPGCHNSLRLSTDNVSRAAA